MFIGNILFFTLCVGYLNFSEPLENKLCGGPGGSTVPAAFLLRSDAEDGFLVSDGDCMDCVFHMVIIIARLKHSVNYYRTVFVILS